MNYLSRESLADFVNTAMNPRDSLTTWALTFNFSCKMLHHEVSYLVKDGAVWLDVWNESEEHYEGYVL